MSDPLATLLNRCSVPSRQLEAPAPDADERQRLFAAAIRVPDHGKLEPWRLIVLEGDAKLEFGQRLARRAVERDPDLPPAKQEKENLRYTFAPLVVAVIARIEAGRIPEQEQLLSAGCVAYNLLLGAQALGYGAQWLTGWAAYDDAVADILGLGEGECVVGFVHIGTPKLDVPMRDRPALDDIVSDWTP
ncbi:nitroreductase family protein [Oleiagrimonas soli]|uniref:Putative NAD(P)H nitroreductase n=1 Tax=Oleiagrimonas soli TaxID=1543381 RepID=A0A099CVZ5_9GAMM|nr:nitroreductase [Oleiagrimonas soli]KGI77205.1 nitroreductase [Oleiagrimonas soli]MBB6185623.1 nitroreductase [Oleiagrimonas soli]